MSMICFIKSQQSFLILATITAISSDQALGGVLAALEGKEKPWKLEFTLSLSGGYDSNAISLADGFSLPAGVQQKDSAYIESEGAVKFTYDFPALPNIKNDINRFSLSYDFIADLLTDISGTDQNIHTVIASYERSLSDVVTGKLTVTDKFLQSEGESVSNLFQVAPLVVFDLSTLDRRLGGFAVGYAFSSNKFLPTGASVHDQERHSLKALQAFVISAKCETEFDLTYIHFWNDARGPDFDFEENAIEAEFVTRFGQAPDWKQSPTPGQRLTLDVSFNYHFDRYSNLNSETAFTRARSDDTAAATVVLSYQVRKTVTVNTTYAYFQDLSNIPVHRYHNHNILAGLAVKFF